MVCPDRCLHRAETLPADGRYVWHSNITQFCRRRKFPQDLDSFKGKSVEQVTVVDALLPGSLPRPV